MAERRGERRLVWSIKGCEGVEGEGRVAVEGCEVELNFI